MIYCVNSSAISLSKNFVVHKRTKHIDKKFHYSRELVNNGEIVLEQNSGVVCRHSDQAIGEEEF